ELVNGEERISEKTDWYTLQDAKMQLPRYSKPGIEIAISSVSTPNSPQIAGKYGLGLLSFGAPPPAWPAVDLARQWAYADESAEDDAQAVDRRDCRSPVPLHVAETREEACRDGRVGFGAWLHVYWGEAVGAGVLAGLDGAPDARHLEATVEQGRAVVG